VRIEDIDKATQLNDLLKEVQAVGMSIPYDHESMRVGLMIVQGQTEPVYVTMSQMQIRKHILEASQDLQEQLATLGARTHQR
jgi:hypothetical protein